MITKKEIEIKEILENHKHWLKKDYDGWEKLKADLREADLSGADLAWANLSGVNLREANLCEANLREANLREADLYGANLSRVNLSGVNLREANLCEANLCEADLYGADLSRANLSGVNLREANLCGANLCGAYFLYGADLTWTNLYGVNLREADLSGTDLCGAINVPFIPFACPDHGSFIGFKKAGEYIVVLEIPEDAKRLSATGRKCRCDKAKVLEIQNMDGTRSNVTSVASNRDAFFVYKVDEIVSVHNFDENRWKECSAGIHFFINRQEAVDYE